jgi:NAD dependent epimerase/dehydratase family enzyme
MDAGCASCRAGIADKRWTDARKKEILSTAWIATEFFSSFSLTGPRSRVPHVHSSLAMGYYGPEKENHIFRKMILLIMNFPRQVCAGQWEEASRRRVLYRTVNFRFGIVLGTDGGA